MSAVLGALLFFACCALAGAAGAATLFLLVRREFKRRLDRCKMEWRP